MTWLDDGNEPDRRDHGRQRQQERDPRCDERSEDEHQHDQRERDRPLARLAELLPELGVERLVRADGARLTDVEVRVRLGDRGSCLRQCVDAGLGDGLGAFHVPLDERRVLVARDEIGMCRRKRRAEVPDRVRRRDRVDDGLNRRAEGGVADRRALALDEDDLRLRVGLTETGLLEKLVGTMGLADVRVLPA